MHLYFRMRRALSTLVAHGESGQTTAEYALLIIGAAVVAGALAVWAKKSGALFDLFDDVIDEIL